MALQAPMGFAQMYTTDFYEDLRFEDNPMLMWCLYHIDQGCLLACLPAWLPACLPVGLPALGWMNNWVLEFYEAQRNPWNPGDIRIYAWWLYLFA